MKTGMKVGKKFYYGTGRRKTSVARVFLKSGSGKVQINRSKTCEEYFKKPEQFKSALSALSVLNLEEFRRCI